MKPSAADTILFDTIGLASLLTWSILAPRLARRDELIPYGPRRRVAWNGWDVLLIVLIAILMQLVGAAAAQAVIDAYVPRGSKGLRDAMLQVVVSVASLAAMALVVRLLISRGADAATLGLRTRRAGRDAVLGLWTFLAAALPVLGLNFVQNYLAPSTQKHRIVVTVESTLPQERLLVLALLSPLAVVVAPLVEEFFFRGVLQGWLEARERVWRRGRGTLRPWPAGGLAILLSSLAFAVAHSGQGWAPWPLFVLALLLGYVYRQTHRLLPCVVAHATLNAVTMSILWVDYWPRQ